MSVLKYQWILWLSCLALGLFIFFLPHQPSQLKANQNILKGQDSSENSVRRAVELMGSEQPMQGIQMLKKIVEKDPKNTEALYQLAFFSLQSGQVDKAIQRFQQIQAVDSSKTDVLYYLSGIYMEQGQYKKALEYLEKFKSKNKDEKIVSDVEAAIQEVKQKLN